jgi:hypothetical protein
MSYHHWETASLKHLLDHAKVQNPYTKKPLAEALIFGIGGGLDAQYKINECAMGQAGGLYIPGRPHLLSKSSTYSKAILKRLGLSPKINSLKDHDQAKFKLTQTLRQRNIAQIFVHKAALPYHLILETRASYQWPHSVVVNDWDQDKEEFSILDTNFKTCLRQERLTQAWENFPTQNLTMLEIQNSKQLSKTQFKQAIHQGLRQHVENAWSLSRNRWYWPGLETWSNLILNNQHRYGWLKRYPDGELYWVVRDAFESIETLGTGGGFYRLLFADFLDECATLIPALSQLQKASSHCRHIGNGWTELAEMLLPDQIKLLKDTKMMLREFQENIQQNREPSPQIAKKLLAIDAQIQRNGFPWGMKRTRQWLEEIRDQLNILIQMEYEALAILAKIIR